MRTVELPEESAARGQIERLVPLTYIFLSIHGIVILITLMNGGTIWQWVAVLSVGLLGISGLTFWPGARANLIRLSYVVIVHWLLQYTNGGTASFFLFWYFVIVVIAPIELKPRYAMALVIAFSLTYLLLFALIPSTIPLVIILARIALFVFIGGMVNALTTLLFNHARELAAARTLLDEEFRIVLTLINTLPDFIYTKDNDGKFTRANQAMLQVLGVKSLDELVGKTAADFFPPERVSQDVEREKQLIQSGQSIVNQEEMLHPQQTRETYWVLTTKVPIRDARGKITGLVSVTRDITLYKQAEQKRIEIEKQEIQLRAERELLELKERFISIVSHEFRTPLTVIATSASLLGTYSDKMTAERRHEALANIEIEIKQMTALLDDVLTLDKTRSATQQNEPTLIDLHAFCEEVIGQIRLTLKEGQRLTYRCDETCDQVSVDEKLLRQTLVNLLANAVKYSPDGGEIRIELTCQPDGLVFRIADQGIGIAPDEFDHLYEPFHRGKNVKAISGTGLGLAIVKTSVDLMGGTIECQSQPGQGTTFTVQLPISS